MTTVPDSQFRTPAVLNELPCVSADRFLNAVPEQVEILQVCQDRNNPSLVIIDFSLVGAYEFTPECRVVTNVTRANRSPQAIRSRINKTYAIVPLVQGHPLNPDIPINTNCQVFNGQLVFDFSAGLPNFMADPLVEFELTMVGSIPTTFNVSFDPQSPKDSYVWEKGKLPSPINIQYSRGTLSTQFLYEGDKNCSCQIQCILPSGVSNDLLFCPDEIQTINIEQGDLTVDPFTVILQVRDSLGNQSNVTIQSLIGVEPLPPIAFKRAGPRRVEMNISPKSINGVELQNVSYQVVKYTGTRNAYIVWKDWSQHGWTFFIDNEVSAGVKYGYAVRYRGEYGDISEYSNWAEIQF